MSKRLWSKDLYLVILELGLALDVFFFASVILEKYM